jgi:hypothetical protein
MAKYYELFPTTPNHPREGALRVRKTTGTAHIPGPVFGAGFDVSKIKEMGLDLNGRDIHDRHPKL